MAAKTNAFNVMLSDEDKARLEELAATTGFSKGQVLRTALENAWMMKCRASPVCATGLNCFVPQMHIAKGISGHVNTVPTALAPEVG